MKQNKKVIYRNEKGEAIVFLYTHTLDLKSVSYYNKDRILIKKIEDLVLYSNKIKAKKLIEKFTKNEIIKEDMIELLKDDII